MSNIVTIGISGNIGSFSEEAAVSYAKKKCFQDYQLKYLINVENVLKKLAAGKINLGVFPIENSNGGIVYEAVYAMAQYTFRIKKMFDLDIRHSLLILPGKNASEIKIIASHDQAIRQCKMYLKRKWPNIELKEWCDTAQAAKDLRDGKLLENVAVIAPKRCAELYDLEILEEDIQDLKFNFTTFIVATKQ